MGFPEKLLAEDEEVQILKAAEQFVNQRVDIHRSLLIFEFYHSARLDS